MKTVWRAITKNEYLILFQLFTETTIWIRFYEIKKQNSIVVLRKKCPENMQRIYRNFIQLKFRHGCSPANWLHIFRSPAPGNTYGGLLLETATLKNFPKVMLNLHTHSLNFHENRTSLQVFLRELYSFFLNIFFIGRFQTTASVFTKTHCSR